MCRDRMNRVLTSVLSVVICASVGAGTERQEAGTKALRMHPVRSVTGAGEARLLPAPEEMVDGDAFVLYEKVVRSAPKDLDWDRIKGWRRMTLKQLPLEDVGSLLRGFDASLPLLEQAGKCKRCDWPLTFEGDPPVDLQSFRNVVFLITLKARCQLARGDCALCVRTLGTGLALARHLGAGPTAIHVLVGAAVTAVVCGEVELYVQQPGAPSLAAALRAIPTPLLDEEHSELYGMDPASRDRVRLVLRRANRHIIALQYIEALRLHAAGTGHWPESLDELKADLPDDPVAGKPFAYKRLSEGRAILEGPLPEGGGAKDAVRYELDLAGDA